MLAILPPAAVKVTSLPLSQIPTTEAKILLTSVGHLERDATALPVIHREADCALALVLDARAYGSNETLPSARSIGGLNEEPIQSSAGGGILVEKSPPLKSKVGMAKAHSRPEAVKLSKLTKRYSH